MLFRILVPIIAGVGVLAVFGSPPFSGGPAPEGILAKHPAEFKDETRRLPNGIYEVSALTPMPGNSANMVEWWFADYLQTTEHYALWEPDSHVWMAWEHKVPGAFIGAHHLVHEYVGDPLLKLRIQFVPHKEILGQNAELSDNELAICAHVGLLESPLNVGRMCHIVENTDDGAVMKSRFWLGKISGQENSGVLGLVAGVFGNFALVRNFAVTSQAAEDLMIHAKTEMGILAGFLPQLYEENH